MKESMITHSSSSNGTAMYDYNSGTVNLRVGENSHCTVYYVENDSADLTEFTSNVYHTYRSPYGIVFFVKPDDGYALTNIKADNTQSEFYSIVDNTNIKETEFYTKNSSTGERIPSVEKLIQGGFTQSNIDSLVQKAKEAGCVAGFIFTRGTNTRGNISSTLSFYAEKLATLKKEVDSVKRNNVPIDLATTKVREGDVIEYSFTVTYYQGEKPITYKSVQVTDSRVTNPQTMTFNGPSSKVTKETKKATYTVTKQDITDAAKIDDKLINTATLTYTYQAPYNNGAYTVSDTATANVTTVGTVSYEYTGTVPNGVANLPATASHEKNEQVRVADRPNNITGYTFKGWTAPADVTVDDATGTFTMPDKSITFTGEWIANKYKVTYKDGDAPLDHLSEEVAYGKVVTVKSYSKDGYTLTGWVDGDKRSYSVSDTFTMPDKDVTLTAVWKEDTTTPTEPENPTSEINAKYFVLMPSKGTPTSGRDQGVQNYFPNKSDKGGVQYGSNLTGYRGNISASIIKEHPEANTKNGYFVANGVDSKYLVVPSDLGYFSGGYNGTFPSALGDNFSMQGKRIIWYVVKNEGTKVLPDYHVDGYLAGIPVELRYHENFDFSGTDDTIGTVNKKGENDLLSGDTVTISGIKETITANHPGWTFVGWTENRDGSGTVYTAGKTKVMMDSCDLYAKWTNTYTVVTHFKDANGTEQENLKQTQENLTGTSGKLLKDLVVKPDLEKIQGTYVHVPSETSYSVNGEDKGTVENATYTEANTVIHQYYYLDETGNLGGDEKGNPTDKKDGIPDAWQHKVTFKVVNGKWNDDSSDNIVVYVNAKDKDGKTLESKLTEAQIPAVGEKPNSGYRASGSWDKSLSADLKITGDTEFTFTYSRRSSGGSSRPSTPPTVDIPDNDVPTGLNGKDHYAYIIGYGNNDVRPQNNITRAEVATIFFRLLTDETREANMTKSNSYNDVKDGDWFCCAVSTLSKMGIIKGYEDGSFKPNDPISRAEFAAIAARFDPDGDKTPATFADVTSHWAKDEISIAANHGWIKGYEDGSFKPDQKITRAETMTLVNRVLNRLPETKDDLHKDMKTWIDNMDETAWYYLAVQEATNSHYFKNKTSTKFEQWTDLRDTRDWSELEK